MKILASLLVVFAVVFGCAGEVDAEPIVALSGDVHTAILQTPEFEVDTSEFGSTGEIIIDVKFHNPTTKFHGLNWVFETSTPDYTPDPVEVYEKYADERRFYIEILNEDGKKLDIESMTVTSNDNFIIPHGITEKYDDRFVVEVLDIDSLIDMMGIGQKIETTLRLSSPELVAEKNYEFGIWTDSRQGTDLISFTLPVIQERVVNTPTPFKGIQTEESVKEIPNWVKDIFELYSNGSIDDSELIGALQYLIKEGIIKV